MAFRIEASIIACLVAQSLFAVPVEYRHHQGDLEVTLDAVTFKGAQTWTWKYDQIQQLTLTETELRILTYEDSKWKIGRDREYIFDHLPEGFAKSVYCQWKDKLDQRFIAALADPDVKSLAEFPAKLKSLTKGTEGTLLFNADRIVFRATKPGESRTWRLADIENIASAGPFDFSLVVQEHHGAWNNATREFRFQLQKPMEETRYNELWRLVTRHP